MLPRSVEACVLVALIFRIMERKCGICIEALK